MLLGPDGNGLFYKVKVENIEVQRKAARALTAGETGVVLISYASSTEVSSV